MAFCNQAPKLQKMTLSISKRDKANADQLSDMYQVHYFWSDRKCTDIFAEVLKVQCEYQKAEKVF